MLDLDILSKEAKSFVGLDPPEKSEEICRRETDFDTYIYYKDIKGQFWYISQSQMNFEKYMQEQKRLRKRRWLLHQRLKHTKKIYKQI